MIIPLGAGVQAVAEEPALLPAPVFYLGNGDAALSELEYEPLRRHHVRVGPRPVLDGPAARNALVERVDRAGLRGRGGAHVPVAAKLRRARSAGGTSVVVANGAEGEPLSRKDAALLSLRPHLVLDGLACAAELVGAERAVVWLHEGSHAARAAVNHAIAERAGHVSDPPLSVQLGPESYLAGESSAAARAVTGGPAVPAFRAGAAARRPVLVHNVETLARLALLARNDESAGDTALLSVSGPAGIVVLETSAATSLGEAITAAGNGSEPRAALLGGYGGTWVAWHRIRNLPLSEAALRRHGLSLGAGIVAPLPDGQCGLARSAEIADFLAAEGAGQCGPCAHGLPELASALAGLARGGRRAKRHVRVLEEVVELLPGRGGCHHPDGAARLAASALRVFGDDVDAHLRGRCEAR